MIYGAGIYPYSIAVGDFNGDGAADLVVANNGGNNISVLLGNGDGTFGRSSTPPPAMGRIRSPLEISISTANWIWP